MKKNSYECDTGQADQSRRLPGRNSAIWLTLLLLVAAQYVLAQSAMAQPGFDKSFFPETIGPGSTSTLVFTIENTEPSPVQDLAFSDTLPAGVVISEFPNAWSTCGGTLTSAPGGSVISLADGTLTANASCNIKVDVTSSVQGTHQNVSGTLTSSQENSPPAEADLTVDIDRPGFSKSFIPSEVLFGERATLKFLIDNAANTNAASSLDFSDELPEGIAVASPANASTDCTNSIVTAEPGSRTIAFRSDQFVNAVPGLGSCTVDVDVVVSAVGILGNSSSELVSFDGNTSSSGKANAIVTGFAHPVHLVKEFLDDPARPGDTVTLEFTLMNRSRSETASNISFTDDLDATLSGLEAVGLPVSACGGTLSGTSLITLTGGSLDSTASCTFSVELSVPSDAPSGSFINQSSAVSSSIDDGQDDAIPGVGASDVLFVTAAPEFGKTFLDNPVGSGGTVELEFQITNVSTEFEATEIAFSDEFDVSLQSASLVPADGSCGPASAFQFMPAFDIYPATLTMTGGSLAASASCTFSITLDVHPMAPTGRIDNSSSLITAVMNEAPEEGPPARDSLEIIGGPPVYKTFINNPMESGDIGILEFRVSNDSNGELDADEYHAITGLGFSDNLDDALSGLDAITPFPLDPCGAGSNLSGTDTVTLADGSLPPGTNCTFQVNIQLPLGATPGIYTNTSSETNAMAATVAVTGNHATDDLDVAGIVLSKEFTDDPVAPGSTVTLEFTLENASTEFSATDIEFFDDLQAALSGLAVTVGQLPANDVCGAGSSLVADSRPSLLNLSSGNLGPGESCTFAVTLDVPDDADPGAYVNAVDVVFATMDGSRVLFGGATDRLFVATPGEAIVTVNKLYTETHPNGDPEVLITLTCDEGQVSPDNGVDVETVGGVAVFTISNPPPEGTNCSAVESVPPGYEQAATDCGSIEVVPGADPQAECTITNRPNEARFTIGKVFSDDNEILGVPVTPVCTDADGGTTITYSPTSGTAYKDAGVDILVKYFHAGASCTATEVAPPGYTQGDMQAAPDCQDPTSISDGSNTNCYLYNVQNPVQITVEKAYTEGGGFAVPVSLDCSSGEVTPEGTLPAEPGSPAVFTLSNFAWDGSTCTATEGALPEGYALISTSCNDMLVLPGPGQQCTLTNGYSELRIIVTKVFRDGSTDVVTAKLSCNDGFLSAESAPVAGGDLAGHTFIVTNFANGVMDCEVTETGSPDGYTTELVGTGLEGSCTYVDMSAAGSPYLCRIWNHAEDAKYTVVKQWKIVNEGGQEVNESAEVTIACNSEIEGETQDSDKLWRKTAWLGDDEELVAMVDTTYGDARCQATEDITRSGIESESSGDCSWHDIPAGGDSSCTFTNTVFFEGIPAVNGYGLVMMALLMLGMGLVGFRRLA